MTEYVYYTDLLEQVYIVLLVVDHKEIGFAGPLCREEVAGVDPYTLSYKLWIPVSVREKIASFKVVTCPERSMLV